MLMNSVNVFMPLFYHFGHLKVTVKLQRRPIKIFGEWARVTDDKIENLGAPQ